jgi:hypothetical protein
MFLGHYGVALAAKRVAPRTCLGWLVAGAVALDLIWPLFLLLGIEHVRIAPGDTVVTPLDFYDYPLTHSLAMVLGWSVLIGGLYYGINRDRKGGLVVGVLVLSHWALDLFMHRPDLPLYPGGPLLGLGLWNSLPITVVVEYGLLAAGVWLYATATVSRDRTGRYVLWAMVTLLAAIYAGNLLGPPPPNARAIGWVGLAQWLFVLMAWWGDAHREVRRTQSAERRGLPV